MCMFMGLISLIDNVMVESSSPVGGSRMLQCGIRAHVAAWASMGHENGVTEEGCPLPSRTNEKMTGKISRKFSKCQDRQVIRRLSWKTLWYRPRWRREIEEFWADEADGKAWRHCNGGGRKMMKTAETSTHLDGRTFDVAGRKQWKPKPQLRRELAEGHRYVSKT